MTEKSQIKISTINQSEPYSIRYSDYFEYDSNSGSYTYRISIENYNGNKTWPLKQCPKCKSDLSEFPVNITELKLGKDEKTRTLGGIISLVIFTMTIISYFLEIPILFYIMIGIFILNAAFFFMSAKLNAKPIILYNCSKCESLIYSKIPPLIHISEHPKDVFRKLENILGFKLK